MIQIGTRKSELALWQANQVKDHLKKIGYASKLVAIESLGDKNLVQPIYSMGIKGVFTKSLDIALINNKIDIAIHSLKDVPTILPKEIEISAYLKRDNPYDVVVYNPNFIDWDVSDTIGTGSLRRRAQWMRKFPKHKTENLRGNIQTRLNKLNKSKWGGAIFAKVGLERLDLLNENNYSVLEWMIPAPGQGIIGIASMKKNEKIAGIIKKLNCKETMLCAEIERNFLRTIQAGCSAPVGAYAYIKDKKIHFKTAIFSTEGKEAIFHEVEIPLHKAKGLGEKSAFQVLKKGGSKLMEKIKNQMR